MDNINIKQQKVEDLIPYENNPRNNENAVEAVAGSIREFGFKNPIIVDQNNVIVAGHTRLLAAKELGLKEVPTIIADDLTTEQINAYRLVDNKTNELAQWDIDMLERELSEIDSIDMEEFGFDDFPDLELDKVIEDDFEDEELDHEEPISQSGEIYQLGSHRLMVGDSTNKEDVRALTDGAQMDLLVTDPPYNVDYNGGTEDAMTIENDNMGKEHFVEFLTAAFGNAAEALRPGGGFYIWHAESTAGEFIKALEAAELEFRQRLIWVKSSLVLGRQDFQWKHEPCFYGWKEGAAHYFTADRTNTTVIEDAPNINAMNKDELKEYIKDLKDVIDEGSTILRADKPSSSRQHPTMKPVKLMAHHLVYSTRQGENVIDLFGGSGSTLMAAEQLGRNCYIMEFDPKYADVIITRWEEFTGQEAELIKEAAHER